ncbi:hypothetical protein V494_08046, partial [Pseudogymnoascus sp. VKM F-4513 (FW-928)]
CDINVDTGSTQCGRGAINTRGRMSAASCSLLLMSGAPTPAGPADPPLQHPGWEHSNSPSLQNAA